MFLESQLEEDINCLRKKPLDGNSTLKRSIHIMHQDTVRLDLTIKIEVNHWTEPMMDWISQSAEGNTAEPAKKMRLEKAEKSILGKREQTNGAD